MKCDPTIVSAYFDGELGLADRGLVAEHLRGCVNCSRLLASYHGIAARLRELPASATPATLDRAVRAALDGADGRRWRHVAVRWASNLGSLAAAVLLVFGFAALLARGQDVAVGGVQAFSPVNAAVDVPVDQAIPISFSRPIDRQSVQERTKVDPPADVAYEWRDRELIVRPKTELRAGTDYRVVVAVPEHQNREATPSIISFRTASPPVATNAGKKVDPSPELRNVAGKDDQAAPNATGAVAGGAGSKSAHANPGRDAPSDTADREAAPSPAAAGATAPSVTQVDRAGKPSANVSRAAGGDAVPRPDTIGVGLARGDKPNGSAPTGRLDDHSSHESTRADANGAAAAAGAAPAAFLPAASTSGDSPKTPPGASKQEDDTRRPSAFPATASRASIASGSRPSDDAVGGAEDCVGSAGWKLAQASSKSSLARQRLGCATGKQLAVVVLAQAGGGHVVDRGDTSYVFNVDGSWRQSNDASVKAKGGTAEAKPGDRVANPEGDDSTAGYWAEFQNGFVIAGRSALYAAFGDGTWQDLSTGPREPDGPDSSRTAGGPTDR